MSAALRSKEGDLLAALKRCTSAEEELRHAKAAAAKLQVERDSLNSELERMSKSKEEEMANLRDSLTESCREKLRKMKEDMTRQENDIFMRGVREHRIRYFLSVQGHQFLRILLKETLEGFCRTPEVLRVLGPGMQFLVDNACQLVMDKIGATPEQRSLYDLDEVVRDVDDKKLDEILGIDSEAPRTPGWWIPVLDKALGLFVDGVCADPLPKRPVVRSPFLDNLRRTACHSPKGNYPGGVIFYPPPPLEPAAEATTSAQIVEPADQGSAAEDQADEEIVMEHP